MSEDRVEYIYRMDLSQDDAEHVLLLYKQAWWAKERTLEATQRVLKGSSHAVGVFTDDGKLIAFGRALSDGVEKAMLFDIIVDKNHQGKGLGKRVVERLCKAPLCRTAQHVELYCKEEMIPFYAKIGFDDITSEVHLLRRTH